MSSHAIVHTNDATVWECHHQSIYYAIKNLIILGVLELLISFTRDLVADNYVIK